MAEKVLIAALDWGIGHATRCVPLINRYRTAGNEVVLASNGTAANFFAYYYPTLELRTDLPGYAVQYPSKGSMAWSMMRQIPRIMKVIRAEHTWLQQNMAAEKWDVVISDNRYGLHHPEAESILVTHQLYIQAPFIAKSLLEMQVRKFASSFDRIWVPDFSADGNLSGKLSHQDRSIDHVEFIGPLSRFQGISQTTKPDESVDILAVISGPEPQRTMLISKLVALLHDSPYKTILLGGEPGKKDIVEKGQIRIIPHLDDASLAGHILHSKSIICRSGYSTLMDLHVLGRKALLIPTPGQTEQEYLADYHVKNHQFVMLQQDRLERAMFAERLQTLQLNQG